MQELTWKSEGRYDTKSKAVHPFELSQELTWPFPPDPQYSPSKKLITYPEAINTRIQGLLNRSRSHNNKTTTDDIQWVNNFIDSAKEAFAIPYQPCFVMQDYKEGNVVVQKIDNHWQISGVFDFMECYFGDGESDLSRPIAMYFEKDASLAKEFLSAYSQIKPLRVGFEKRFPIYMLADRLIIWEYYQRHGNPYWDKKLTLQEWIHPYLELLNY